MEKARGGRRRTETLRRPCQLDKPLPIRFWTISSIYHQTGNGTDRRGIRQHPSGRQDGGRYPARRRYSLLLQAVTAIHSPPKATGRRGGFAFAKGLDDSEITGTSKDCVIMGTYKPDDEADLKNSRQVQGSRYAHRPRSARSPVISGFPRDGQSTKRLMSTSAA